MDGFNLSLRTVEFNDPMRNNEEESQIASRRNVSMPSVQDRAQPARIVDAPSASFLAHLASILASFASCFAAFASCDYDPISAYGQGDFPPQEERQ
jgi:hypothetical protein